MDIAIDICGWVLANEMMVKLEKPESFEARQPAHHCGTALELPHPGWRSRSKRPKEQAPAWRKAVRVAP
jgi:hypothetical protein